MGLQMRDSLALHGGRHNFFDSSFFSLAYSSSSAFSRLESETVIPDYFAFQA
jgi:hypothetical protein